MKNKRVKADKLDKLHNRMTNMLFGMREKAMQKEQKQRIYLSEIELFTALWINED